MENAPQYQQQEQQNKQMNGSRFWKYLLTVLITVFVTFSLTAGIGIAVIYGMDLFSTGIFRGDDDTLSMRFEDDPATRDSLNKLYSAYQALKENYYQELSDAELLEAMTRGLVNEMDSPYTMYMTAEQVARIEESISGQYSGIGAYVALNQDGMVEIADVIEDSPAEEAGVLIGDVFLEVDGEDVSGFRDINSVAALVRGIPGTNVSIVLYRPSIAGTVELEVTRQMITTVSVSHRMLTPVIGYVYIREFNHNSAEKFVAAVDELQQSGALQIVFDLRNNTGGLASEVIYMLDYLLPDAVIATVRGRQDGKFFEENWRSGRSVGVPAEMEYAILINSMSASASELFAGCLRDYDKARLIGEQSLGKGSGTVSFSLPDGSAVNVTNFLYYLPGGSSIEGVGLEPDDIVYLPEEAYGLPINRIPSEMDSQLRAAIDYLNR